MLRPTGWWLALKPIDLRCGMDRLLVLVQTQFGRDGFDGAAYAFRNCSGTRLKIVCADAHAQVPHFAPEFRAIEWPECLRVRRAAGLLGVGSR